MKDKTLNIDNWGGGRVPVSVGRFHNRMYPSYDPYSYLNDPLWELEIQSYIVQTRKKRVFREANETLLWHMLHQERVIIFEQHYSVKITLLNF